MRPCRLGSEDEFRRFQEHFHEPRIRQHVAAEMRTYAAEWENLLLMAGSADNVLLVGFKNAASKRLPGKSLGAVARHRRQTPEETAIELIVEDGSRIECIYFLMSEENVRKSVALPWVTFCSDSPSLAKAELCLSNSTPSAGLRQFRTGCWRPTRGTQRSFLAGGHPPLDSTCPPAPWGFAAAGCCNRGILPRLVLDRRRSRTLRRTRTPTSMLRACGRCW